MTKYFKLFAAIVFVVRVITSYSAFMVTQTSFGVDLNRPVTEDTTLINQGNKPVRVKVDFEKPNWLNKEYYLGDQLVVYPKIVTIPPKGKIQIKVAPRIKKNLEDGEYAALIVFKELPSRNNKGQLTMLMNVGVPYYGRKGELQVGMKLETFRIIKKSGGYEFLGKGKNVGNFSYNLNIIIKFYKNKKLVGEKNLKQGFYRGGILDIKKFISLDIKADYAEVIFENNKYDFSKILTFEL